MGDLEKLLTTGPVEVFGTPGLKLAEITEPCQPAGTVMCFWQDEPPAGWEFMHKKPDNEVPVLARGQQVITCRKL